MSTLQRDDFLQSDEKTTAKFDSNLWLYCLDKSRAKLLLLEPQWADSYRQLTDVDATVEQIGFALTGIAKYKQFTGSLCELPKFNHIKFVD